MATAVVQLLTVIQAAEHLCLSRSNVYELLADGGLPSVRIGRNKHITMTALAELITQHSEIGINVSPTEATAASV